MKYIIFLLCILQCNAFLNFCSIFRSSKNIINQYYNHDDMYYKSVNNKKNVSLVIWNGYNIKPIYYNKFVNLIQEIGYKKGLGIECHVVRKYKKPKNLTNYYLFGHSSGGYQVLKDEYDKNIKANIVYGATHNSNKKLYFGIGKLKKEPLKKTLVILGDRDKFINVFNLNDEIEKNSSYIHLISQNNYHDSISNGETNIIGKFLKDEKLYNNSYLSEEIAKYLIEYILYIEGDDNNMDYLIEDTNKYLECLNYVNYVDKTIVPSYVLNNLFNDIEYQVFNDLIKFIISKPFLNNLKLYVDYNTIWIKSFNKKLSITNLEKCYNNIFNESKLFYSNYKVIVNKNKNTLDWIKNKPYIDNDKIIIQEFSFLFFNYYKVPTLVHFCMNV